MLVLIGLKNIHIRTARRVDRSGQHRPPMVFSRMSQSLSLAHQAITRLTRGRVGLGWTSPPRPARAPGFCHDTRADHMRPPGAWTVASSSWPPALTFRNGGFGIRLTGKPPGLSLLDVRRDDCGFLRVCGGRGLGLLLRQLARMHHEKAQRFLRHPPSAVLDLYRPDDALPRPRAARCVLGPPRLFPSEGQGGLLLSPGFQLVAHRPGAWHEGHQAPPLFPTQASRPSTLCLAIRHDAVDTLQT